MSATPVAAHDVLPCASLPMYDWPELHRAHDRFWQAVATRLWERGLEMPEILTRCDDPFEVWHRSGMILSQTCGYPLSTALKGKVRYLASPVYNVEGCEGPRYSSAVLARRDSSLKLDGLWGKVFAFNSIDSLSGYRAARAMFGDMGCFFGKTMKTGSHRQSAQTVVAGDADVATLDAVCWHLLQRHEPKTADQLKVLGWTKSLPALPFITSLETSEDTIELLRDALAEVVDDPDMGATCRMMALDGVKILSVSDYDRLSRY